MVINNIIADYRRLLDYGPECILPYLCMVTVPHILVGLERMLDYRGVGLVRFRSLCVVQIRIFTPSVHWRITQVVASETVTRAGPVLFRQ